MKVCFVARQRTARLPLFCFPDKEGITAQCGDNLAQVRGTAETASANRNRIANLPVRLRLPHVAQFGCWEQTHWPRCLVAEWWKEQILLVGLMNSQQVF